MRRAIFGSARTEVRGAAIMQRLRNNFSSQKEDGDVIVLARWGRRRKTPSQAVNGQSKVLAEIEKATFGRLAGVLEFS